VGDDRVLFGTDAPMRDPRPQVGWLVFTRLPEQSKRKIFGSNFARILGECFNGTYAQNSGG
jgi:predicted TIM-barrel fold metal-dependent hydrolase